MSDIDAQQLTANVAELEATKRRLEATTANLEMALDIANEGARAKAQFVAMISHELRTPLNAIIGFSELMSEQMFGPLNERYQEFVRDIQVSGTHLRQIVDDILDLSKLEGERLRLDESVLDISAVIDEVLLMMGDPAAKKEIRLSKQCEEQLPLMRADGRRLLQVLSNLLSNGIAFTPNGGTVTVCAERRPDGLVVTVSDTGAGMAAEEIPKALESFGQVDGSLSRKHEGTGLGLFISRKLMELHDGSLTIVSQRGVGTSVRLTFPADRIVEKLQAA